MARSHPLIEVRQLEYEFEKVFRELEQRKQEPEYVQDVEFFNKLKELRLKYGYSLVEVADLLVSRYVGAVDMLPGGVGSINTKAVKQLVDIYTEPSDLNPLPDRSKKLSSASVEQIDS